MYSTIEQRGKCMLLMSIAAQGTGSLHARTGGMILYTPETCLHLLFPLPYKSCDCFLLMTQPYPRISSADLFSFSTMKFTFSFEFFLSSFFLTLFFCCQSSNSQLISTRALSFNLCIFSNFRWERFHFQPSVSDEHVMATVPGYFHCH